LHTVTDSDISSLRSGIPFRYNDASLLQPFWNSLAEESSYLLLISVLEANKVSTASTHPNSPNIAAILGRNEAEILAEWMREMTGATRRSDLMQDSELHSQCAQFLKALRQAAETDSNVQGAAWKPVKEMLADVSRSRAIQGFSPSETAMFVFSLKKPVFAQIRTAYQSQPEALAAITWSLTEMLDNLGLYTTEVYQESREQIIKRQQEELLELSTPVVKLWDGILALPVIGTLDSARTQVVMESLLQAIVQTNSRVAIIDITGVPTVDTVVAQHLLKTVTAARLMGADCIISGVRPQIAQTIVHLGINLLDVTTKATLSAAFSVALQRLGMAFVKDTAKS
jgi:rsbT co-antagonist protein RsbR